MIDQKQPFQETGEDKTPEEEMVEGSTGAEEPSGDEDKKALEDSQVPGETEEDELDKCRREIENYKDRWMRAEANLDNYRKRAARERKELVQYGNEKVLREIIVVMDNLERAFNHARETDNVTPIIDGIHNIMDQFSSTLKKLGVEAIQAKGFQFDPHLHEAVMQVESGDQPPNTVVEELEKGYLLNDRLLRPAKVMVSKSPKEEE